VFEAETGGGMRARFLARPEAWGKLPIWPTILVGLVILRAVASVIGPDSAVLNYNGIAYFLLLSLATGLAIRNAIQNTLENRPFWIFLAMGYGLWALDQWIFLYYYFFLRTEIPDNSTADTVLFLHIVLLMAAVVTLPSRSETQPKLYPIVLNAFLLVTFWSFLYVYAVFPYQLFPNATSYAQRFDILYPLENWSLILAIGVLSLRVSGTWKKVYLHLLGASTLYTLSSAVANLAIDSGEYIGGKLYGVGLTAAVCWFVWIPLRARRAEVAQVKEIRAKSEEGLKGSAWAMLVVVIIAIPVVWELSRSNGPAGMRTFRILVAIAAMVCLASAAFLEEYLAKRELAAHLSMANGRLHLAMESGKAAGWDWDVKSGKVSWFGDLKTSFGMDAESYVGSVEGFRRFVHEDDRERVAEAEREARKSRGLYAVEFRVVWPDGTVRWVAAKGAFQYSAKGQPTRMLGTAIDITARKELQAELDESRDRISAIVESAMDAIIAINEEQKIVLFNPAAEKMFGCGREEAIGSGLERFIPAGSRGRHGAHVRNFAASGSSRTMDALGTLLAIKASGEGFPIEASISHSNISGKILFTVIIRDVTERRRAEEAIRESEDRFRRVADSAPVLIWMSDVDKQCTFFNQGWLTFTGRTLGQEMRSGWLEGVHQEDVERCLRTYTEAFDRREPFEMEYRLRRFDGEYRWIVDFGTPRFETNGTFCGYVGSCVDITERKYSEESLHALSGRLIGAQEEERARIARELHDDFSQRMALLGIGLGQLWKNLPDSDVEDRTHVTELLRGVREMSTDIHLLSHQLHSSKLEHVGLVPAVKGLCKEISDKYKIRVYFSDSDCPRTIPKDVSLCLFRVTQEALGNVIKHSGSAYVEVELAGIQNVLTLRVADAGKGFNPDNTQESAGIGLVGMRERLRLVKGSLRVRSEINQGTEIAAEVPLRADEADPLIRTQAAGGQV
jgi:PAS domain S-box-containing protein